MIHREGNDGFLLRHFLFGKSLPPLLETSGDVLGVFLELFRGHGLACKLEDGWIVAESGCLRVRSHGSPVSRALGVSRCNSMWRWRRRMGSDGPIPVEASANHCTRRSGMRFGLSAPAHSTSFLPRIPVWTARVARSWSRKSRASAARLQRAAFICGEIGRGRRRRTGSGWTGWSARSRKRPPLRGASLASIVSFPMLGCGCGQ